MNLERLANKVVAVVAVDDSVDLAIRHMQQLNIRHLPVVCGNVPVGMVSDRDVLFHVCWLDHVESSLAGEGSRPASGASRIDRIMTSPAVVLSPEDPIEKAARLMLNKRISCVPLVANDAVVGIVTETDFLRRFNDQACLVPGPNCRQQSVADHASAHVFSVRPSDATLTAIRLMRDKQVRHIPVMDDDDLVGIISDRDVLRGTAHEETEQALSVTDFRVSDEHQVQGIMSTHLKVLPPTATLAQAADRMVTYKIGALPVVQEGKLMGIITETDLLRAFVADCH